MDAYRKEEILPSTLEAESKFPPVPIAELVCVLLTLLPHYSKGLLKKKNKKTHPFIDEINIDEKKTKHY